MNSNRRSAAGKKLSLELSEEIVVPIDSNDSGDSKIGGGGSI